MPVELLVGAAVGAAAASPKARKVVRTGMLYGVAGLLMVYDKVASLTSDIVKGARKSMAEETTVAAQNTAAPAAPTAGSAQPKAGAPAPRPTETAASN